MTVIEKIIQTEPIPPAIGKQRIHFNRMIRTGTQTYQTGNYQIIESGMIVITAPFLIAFQPLCGHFIQILADVGTPPVILRFYIPFHLMKIDTVGQDRLCRTVHKIGHRR